MTPPLPRSTVSIRGVARLIIIYNVRWLLSIHAYTLVILLHING